MDEQLMERSPLAEKKKENSGSWLWKNLKPFGCILCLVCMAAFLFFCFSSGPEPIPGYEPAQSREFYLEDPHALVRELQENVQPRLAALLDCYVEEDKVVLVLSAEEFTTARASILKYFDQDNLIFLQE